MTAFSLGTVWEETIAFLRREAHLLVPVALALFGPAQILVMTAMGPSVARPDSANPQSILALPGLLLILFGNLAITRIALVPGASVGEALSGAFRRIPVALATCLAIGFSLVAVAIVIIIAAALGMMTSGGSLGADAKDQISLLIVIPMLILFVRLLMLMPVLAMEKGGVIASIRRTWDLGRGNSLRFLAVFLLSIAINVTFAMINFIVIGALAGLLRMLVGGEFVTALQLLVTGLVGALLMLGLTVYVAFAYRRLISD